MRYGRWVGSHGGQAFAEKVADGDAPLEEFFKVYYPLMCRDMGLPAESEQAKQQVFLGPTSLGFAGRPEDACSPGFGGRARRVFLRPAGRGGPCSKVAPPNPF